MKMLKNQSVITTKCDSCDGSLAYGRDWDYCAYCGRYRHVISGKATNTKRIAKGLVKCLDSKGQPILLTPAAAAYLKTKRQAQAEQEERQG